MDNSYVARHYHKVARENVKKGVELVKIIKLVEARAELGYWFLDIGELPAHIRSSLKENGFEVSMAPNRDWRIVWYMGDESL